MKCPDCQTKNINDANYCKKCCHSFTEEEKEIAYSKTIYGKIEKYKDLYERLTLKKITDDIRFKIFILIIIIGYGIFTALNYELAFRVEESSNYEIQYNKKDNEHYLIVTEEETPLNLYIPNRTKKILLKEWTSDNKLVNETEYTKSDNIKLNVTTSDDYYTVEAIYTDKNSDILKVYVYQTIKEN